MRVFVAVLLGGVLLVSCSRKERAPSRDTQQDAHHDTHATPLLKWTVDSVHRGTETFTLASDGEASYTSKRKDAEVKTSRRLSNAELTEVKHKLVAMSCCALKSNRGQDHLDEARPHLSIALPNMRCELDLWDGEWLQGRALECGLVVAGIHGRGFVPDPPRGSP